MKNEKEKLLFSLVSSKAGYLRLDIWIYDIRRCLLDIYTRIIVLSHPHTKLHRFSKNDIKKSKTILTLLEVIIEKQTGSLSIANCIVYNISKDQASFPSPYKNK